MKFKSITALFLCGFAFAGGLFAEGAVGRAGGSAVSRSNEELGPEVFPESRMVVELDRFYGKLRADYGYEPEGEPVSNFVEGAPALTPESVRLALRRPLAAADSLVESITALAGLIDDLEAGSVARQAFKTQFEHHLERIDSLARLVEKDDYLRLLDLGRDLQSDTLAAAGSLDELRNRVADLGRVARSMRASLASNTSEDWTQVVSVQHLSQPSFRSLCQGIVRLAVSLRGSIEGL